MVAQENEEFVHIRPACAECTHRCNMIHGDKDLEEEKFDPDRSYPHFAKKVTKFALHHSPQAALCIPGTFMEKYPNSFPKDKPITMQGPSGNQWTVRVTERTVLHAGWRAFAHDHRLRSGDNLQFRLTEPSHLIVEIFDSHGDVRRSARRATVTGKYADPDALPLTRNHHSKKRKVDMAELARMGKRIMSDGVERWNTPAKRGFTSFNEPVPKLRFSEETKQWESHEEKVKRGDHVVTIDLDSEEDEKNSAKPDVFEVFLGRPWKEGDEDFITPQSKAFATHAEEDQKVVDAKKHHEIISDGEDDFAVQENEPFDEEEKQPPSDDPLRQFSNIFNTTRQDFLEDLQETAKGTAEKAAVKAAVEKKIETASDRFSRTAPILCDEDRTLANEEEDEDDHSELDKTTPQACGTVERKLETIALEQGFTPNEEQNQHEGLEADNATKKGQHSETCDNRPKVEVKIPEAAAADIEPVTGHNAVYSSTVTLRQTIEEMSKMYESNSKAEDVNGKHNEDPSPKQMQEEEGGFSFGLSPDNDFECPEVINSIEGDRTHSKHPLKQGLKQARDEETLKQMEDDEHDVIESKTSCSIFKARELDVIKTEPEVEKEENPNIPISGENAKEKEAVLQSIANPEFATPEKEKDITTNTCVLESKRWQVFPSDREKALRAAQAWVRKIRNPHFMTVMKSSQVYTDFIMDIPADFAKHSKLPSHVRSLRVTLVCDEVPTNCKALWLAHQSQLDCKGWQNFSRNHRLEEGDVCVFECLPPANPTTTSIRFGVYICRVIKLTKSIMPDWTQHYKVLQGDKDEAGAANGSPFPSPSPSPSPAQDHSPGGTNQAYEV